MENFRNPIIYVPPEKISEYSGWAPVSNIPIQKTPENYSVIHAVEKDSVVLLNDQGDTERITQVEFLKRFRYDAVIDNYERTCFFIPLIDTEYFNNLGGKIGVQQAILGSNMLNWKIEFGQLDVLGLLKMFKNDKKIQNHPFSLAAFYTFQRMIEFYPILITQENINENMDRLLEAQKSGISGTGTMSRLLKFDANLKMISQGEQPFDTF